MGKTEENLKKAFIDECQACLRYMFFAEIADEMGYPEIGNMFRSIGKGEETHARGYLFYMAKLGLVKFGNIKDTLEISIRKEMDETENVYPRIAKEAREEGHEEIAEWAERVGKAEENHLKACKKLLNSLD
jgi:rubrerythrin